MQHATRAAVDFLLSKPLDRDGCYPTEELRRHLEGVLPGQNDIATKVMLTIEDNYFDLPPGSRDNSRFRLNARGRQFLIDAVGTDIVKTWRVELWKSGEPATEPAHIAVNVQRTISVANWVRSIGEDPIIRGPRDISTDERERIRAAGYENC